MRDEFTFLRLAILLGASVLVFGVGSRTFREASQLRVRTIEAMRAATNAAMATAVAQSVVVGRLCPEPCWEDGPITNIDRPRIH